MELTRTHLLLDMWLSDPMLLEQVAPWRETLLRAAHESEAIVLAHHFHQFEPSGITGYLLLAESHLSVHTWPEEKLAAIDIFTCGTMNTDHILRRLRDRFSPERETLRHVRRG